MRARKKSLEDMNKRCEFLISLGFDIDHEDSSVGMGGIDFDFSATNMDADSVIRAAIKKAYDEGSKAGAKEIQDGLKKLLSVEN